MNEHLRAIILLFAFVLLFIVWLIRQHAHQVRLYQIAKMNERATRLSADPECRSCPVFEQCDHVEPRR